MKFQPEHFPVGTVFEVAEQVAMCRYTAKIIGEGENTRTIYEENPDLPRIRVFTVEKVIRSGPARYIVVTTTPSEGYVKHNESYAFDWVERIISRGDGPVKIDHEPGVDSANFHRKEMDLTQSGWGVKHPKQVGAPKSHYIIMSFESMIWLLCRKFSKLGHFVLDTHRMGRALGRQSFVHHVMFGHFHVSYAPKKRVNAWFKANVNRFLVPVKKAQREKDKFDAEEFDMDMDVLASSLAKGSTRRVWCDSSYS